MDTADKVAAFGGRSVSGGRLNAGRAVGSTVLPVAFTYTGFGGAVAGTPITGAANVSVDAPSRLPSGTISMRVTLATKFGSQVYGVAGQALRYAFNSGEQSAVTDDGGVAVLGPMPAASVQSLANGSTVLVPLATLLPPGDYAVMS